MVKILTRAECGLPSPNPSRLTNRHDVVTSITVHDCGADVADPVAKWRQITELAMAGRLPSGDTYGDCPYNAGVTQDGRILEGRSSHVVGAHATSHDNIANRTSLGVCLVGSGNSLSALAQQALMEYFDLGAYVSHRPALLPLDHYDWRALGGISTSCPGPATAAFVAQIRIHQRSGKAA